MSNNESRPSRRAALLGDRPGSYAIARHVRMSPTKVRRVVNLVRGMDAKEALVTLKFAPQAASEPVYKVLASAIGVGGLPGFISIIPQYIPMFVIGMLMAIVVPFVLTCALSLKIIRPGYRVA